MYTLFFLKFTIDLLILFFIQIHINIFFFTLHSCNKIIENAINIYIEHVRTIIII